MVMGRKRTDNGTGRIRTVAVATLLLLGLIPATATAEGFTVELADALVPGRPGETVGTMTGSGCLPSEVIEGPSRVVASIPEVAPFGLPLAAVDAEADGSFGPTDLVVPDGATPGVYDDLHVSCRLSDTGGDLSLGPVEILPPNQAPASPTGTLTPDAVVVQPGQPVTFTGPVEGTMEGLHEHAFVVGQEITLVLYPGANVVGTVTAPTSPGTVDLQIDAPAAVGSYVLAAFGKLEFTPGLIHGPSFVADVTVSVDTEPETPDDPEEPTGPVTPADPGFSDVQPGDVHADAILRLADLGILLGYPDATFRPSEELTRGQMASVLARALGLAPVSEGPFPDVDPTGVHAGAINALAAAGLVEGRPDGTFDLHGSTTRGQLSSILAAAAGLPDGDEDDFSDIAGSVHAGAIAALAEAGIIEGYPDGTFRPGEMVTRAQAATFVAGLLDLLDEA
jgi:hypothetical protein